MPGPIHVFRLKPQDDLKEAIQFFAEQKAIEAAVVICCVGSLTRAHLRFANQPKGSAMDGPYEIVGLTGTVSRGGCHLHISVAGRDGRTLGGHLLTGNLVYTTAEIALQEIEGLAFTRTFDPTTGFKELEINPRI